ncbi:LysR family transcriptional regulator [Rhizobium sp. BK251]|uniref:LysR family transcriptional regulator n=1 Tax=Rhizobium sp. BK251 TaxID=2512125 RepID=UPI001051D5C0|nr:LysR family transcriptional regulator [Rhizobium sp. BK251]TCL69486.1 DNA-binding transcriptional LysR family regulator [Rhizobium sp. BK251]
MRQDQLDGLITFVTVAQEKGFTAAAVRLGVSPSAVSQSIRTLEERLGLVLFNRTTRSISLTEAGGRYFEMISPSIDTILGAVDELGEDGEEPSGLLRLNVPRAAFLIVLQPVMKAFLAAHPQVRLEISVENTLIDIVGRGFDAGIRFGDLVEKDMVGVTIGPPISAHIIASPEYVEAHGMPVHPRDLLGHECITFRHVTTGQIERWAFAKGNEEFELAVDGRLTINDSSALVQAALDGLGIAYMINGYIERFIEQGRLVRLLPDWSPSFPGLMLYYPDRRRVPLKLRALIDFLKRPAMDRPVLQLLGDFR